MPRHEQESLHVAHGLFCPFKLLRCVNHPRCLLRYRVEPYRGNVDTHATTWCVPRCRSSQSPKTHPAVLVGGAETPDQTRSALAKKHRDRVETVQQWESFPRETPVAVGLSLWPPVVIPRGALPTPGGRNTVGTVAGKLMVSALRSPSSCGLSLNVCPLPTAR